MAKITEWAKDAETLMGRHPQVMGDLTGGRLEPIPLSMGWMSSPFTPRVCIRTAADAGRDGKPCHSGFGWGKERRVSAYTVLEMQDAARSIPVILKERQNAIPDSPGLRYDSGTKVWIINGKTSDGVAFSITWDTTTNIVTSKGKIAGRLKDEQATYLQAILVADGECRDKNQIFGIDAVEHEINITRVRKGLPKPLPEIIEPKPGKGARLRTEWLK